MLRLTRGSKPWLLSEVSDLMRKKFYLGRTELFDRNENENEDIGFYYVLFE